MNVVMDKAQYEKGRSLEEEKEGDDNLVKKALLETVTTGRVGNLAVDPEYFVFVPQGSKLSFDILSILILHYIIFYHTPHYTKPSVT
jgi:hypothetical protein